MPTHTLGRLITTAVVAVVAITAWSQKSVEPSQISAQLPVIHFQSPEGSVPQDWTLRPRTPIKFTPFEMVDPNTGKPVNANDIIEVDGVKMKAGEFYRQLNAMEQWLNEHGYSLREDTPLEYYSPTLEEELAKSEEYLKWLEANAPLDGNVYGQPSDFSIASCNAYSNSWDSGWIGNSLFGIKLGGGVNVQACLENATYTISGSAVLRGRLAGFAHDLAKASGSVTINPAAAYYHIEAHLLGRRVWSASGSEGLVYQHTWQHTLGSPAWESPEIPLFCVSVLWFPVCANGQVGIAGQMNLTASVTIDPFQQRASAGPHGYLRGYARAWLSAGVGIRAEVGIEGNITFLEGGITGAVSGRVGFDHSPYYAVNASLNAHLGALSGNIKGWARGCVRIRRPFRIRWCSGRLSVTLFRWDGWSYSGTLVSWDHTFRL